MAQIKIKNNREHDININWLANGEVKTLLIPAARAHEMDPGTMIAGEAIADEDDIKAAVKKYPTVRHYFTEGWLQTETAPRGGKQVEATPAGE